MEERGELRREVRGRNVDAPFDLAEGPVALRQRRRAVARRQRPIVATPALVDAAGSGARVCSMEQFPPRFAGSACAWLQCRGRCGRSLPAAPEHHPRTR